MQKVTKRKCLILFINLMITGVLVIQIDFTSLWGIWLTPVIFVITAFTGLMYVIILGVNRYKIKNKLRITDWLELSIILVALISSIIIFFTISALNNRLINLDFKKELEFKNLTVYLYQKGCFPPDNSCECDYYSLIYVKDQYFPIMHLKKKVDFYIKNIELKDNKLIIKAGECEQDLHKQVIIDLQ